MKVQPYSKKELALAYAPNISMSGALNRLAAWIKHNPQLVSALQQTGYTSNQRVFTSKQVELIFEYLGEPWQSPTSGHSLTANTALAFEEL